MTRLLPLLVLLLVIAACYVLALLTRPAPRLAQS